MNINEYRTQGTIKDLPPNEVEQYLSFLNETYEENLKVSEFLLVKYPRWSIIAGYYAMHDVSKLYLGKKFGLKLSQPQVHIAVIDALRELVKRKEIIGLMEEAASSEIIALHLALLRGKDEREKSQYYTSLLSSPKVSMQKASYFLEKLVKPYASLVLELMK